MSDHEINHKALFDQMPVSRFLVKQKGDSFTVCEANSKALEYLGLDLLNGQSKPIEDCFVKENAALMRESFLACVEKKTPVTISAPRRVEGSPYISGFWVNPIFDDQCNILLLDVIAQPTIADTSIIERERDDALRLLTSIFDASEVGILVSDRKRHIIKINDSFTRIYGWDRHDAMGKDFTQFVTDDEKAIATRNHAHFIQNGERQTGEVKILKKDGEIANAWYATATLTLSEDRRFQVTTLIDMTMHKQMERSLRLAKDQADAANHAKSAFLANMSHELRTPLNAVIGFSEMMIKETFGPLGDPKYAEYLGDIHLSARHLLEIINEVLDMSKIEAGRVDLDEREVDIVALVETVARIATSRIFSSDLSVKVDVRADFPRLYSDPRLLRQILINLVTNAVKYSPNGGVITISGEDRGKDGLDLIVSDQGMGIPEDRVKEAMEPFGQIHEPTQSTPYQGTGLGLPLAKAMVEMHGGHLNLKSKEGEGTTVSISFPAQRVRRVASTNSILDEKPSVPENVEEVELIQSAE
ncbi:MAG: PAS domain-containing sensor histidine kinase [Micavibrio sp.]|nr:PAS domain-containing sensor histidine kinase [Micavibrio sp.]